MVDEKERTAVVQQFGRTYRAFMTAFEAHVDIPWPRWRIMLALSEWTAAQPQKILVKTLGMDPGALTRQVQELEKRKLIERMVDERDNRLTNVMLTDVGRQEFERALPSRDHFLAATLNDEVFELLRDMVPALELLESRIASIKDRASSAPETMSGNDVVAFPSAAKVSAMTHGAPSAASSVTSGQDGAPTSEVRPPFRVR